MIGNTAQSSGFEVYPGVIDQSERSRLLEALGSVPRTRAGSRHVLSCPTVSALVADPRLTSIAKAFLGVEPFPFRATLFDKSAAANWLVVWHQDTKLQMTTDHVGTMMPFTWKEESISSVQRTRSSASPPHSPLTRHLLGGTKGKG